MIRYVQDFKQKQIGRTIYSLLDWLGDIGGFQQGLSWIALLVIFMFQFQPLNTYLVNKLYSYENYSDSMNLDIEDVTSKPKQNRENLKLSNSGYLKMLMYQQLPECLGEKYGRLLFNRIEHTFVKASEYLEKETNIVRIL